MSSVGKRHCEACCDVSFLFLSFHVYLMLNSSIILYCIVLYCLYCVVLHYIASYCTVIALYSTVFYCVV